MEKMKIAMANDHAGTQMKEALKKAPDEALARAIHDVLLKEKL